MKFNGIDIEKIKRSNVLNYLNTTPTENTATYNLIGCGITEQAIDYSADKESEQWITEDVKRNNINGYEISSGVSQTCYKGDPVFEYINKIRRDEDVDKLCYSDIIEVEKLYSTGEGASIKYQATKHDVIIEITKWLGDKTVMEYTINFNGTGTKGYVTFTDNKPVFTASAD